MGWLVPELEGQHGIRRAGRRGAAWVKPPREEGTRGRWEQFRVTGTQRQCGRRQRSKNGARVLGALCVPGSVPALCRVPGPPRQPLPVLAPFRDSVPGPVISGAFPGSPLLIVTTNLPGGYHQPHTNGDESTERLHTQRTNG